MNSVLAKSVTKDPTRLQNRDKAVVNCHSGGGRWAKSWSLTNRAIPESPSVKDLVCRRLDEIVRFAFNVEREIFDG